MFKKIVNVNTKSKILIPRGLMRSFDCQISILMGGLFLL